MKKKTALAACIAALLAVSSAAGFLCWSYYRLPVYEWQDDLIKGNGRTYRSSSMPDLTSIKDGQMLGKTIGRFKGDHLLGFKTWVLRIEGYEEKKAVYVRGLMFDAVYVNIENTGTLQNP